jgi:hypothetical protein
LPAMTQCRTFALPFSSQRSAFVIDAKEFLDPAEI